MTYDGFSTNGLESSDDLAIVDTYTNWLEGKIIDINGTAISGLSTAPHVTLSQGVGTADFATNRMGLPANRDTDVPVLAFRSMVDNSVVALVFGYACHPIITGSTAPMYDHPDYPGYARRTMEQDNPGGMAFFIQGTAGDTNPASIEGPPYVEDLGADLSTVVQSVLTGSEMQPVSGPILPTISNVNLPLALDPQDADHAAMRAKYVAIRDLGLSGWVTRHANQMNAQIDAGTLPLSEPWPVAVWHFGTNKSLVLAALGGEVVSDYALTLKQQFAGQLGSKLWIAEYSNEVPDYIPTNQVWDLTRYEAGWVCGDDYSAPTISSFSTSQMYYSWPAALKRGHSDTGGSVKGVEELVLENTIRLINIPLNLPPTITFVSRTAPNTDGWNTTNVVVNWTSADAIWGRCDANHLPDCVQRRNKPLSYRHLCQQYRHHHLQHPVRHQD